VHSRKKKPRLLLTRLHPTITAAMAIIYVRPGGKVCSRPCGRPVDRPCWPEFTSSIGNGRYLAHDCKRCTNAIRQYFQCSLPSIKDPTLGLFDVLPLEIRIKIYGPCMQNNRVAVRHSSISNTISRQDSPARIIARPTPLALASKRFREEIYGEAEHSIDTIPLHEICVHYDFAISYAPPPGMSTMARAKHVSIKVTTSTPTLSEYDQIEEMWPGTESNHFFPNLLQTLPQLDTLICTVLNSTNLDQKPALRLISHDLGHLMIAKPTIKHTVTLEGGR